MRSSDIGAESLHGAADEVRLSIDVCALPLVRHLC